MSINVSTPVMEPDKLPTNPFVEKYSVNYLLRDWNQRNIEMFLHYWLAILINNAEFMITYVGDIPSVMTRLILVKEDMNVIESSFRIFLSNIILVMSRHISHCFIKNMCTSV